MADNKLTVTIDGKDNLSSELKRVESGVIRFVGAVSSALAAVTAIAFPVLESARFQKELLETGKTTDYVKEQLETLKVGLVDLSTQINVSAVDLAKIATMGGQLGIGGGGNVGGLLSFVREISTAVTALDVSAEEAVTAIGKLINIFNVPATQYRNLVSALNEVSNSSNATASELFDVTRRIGDLGGSVNIPEAAALSASMIDLGLTAETAGTTVTKIFADMKSKAQEFSNFVGEDMTQQKWVEMLQGKGLSALDLYLDKLNAIPPAAAAAAKIDLTGGGRIFEAVTKLQQQRARAQALEKRADRDTLTLEANKVNMSQEQIRLANEQIAAIRKQAREINVVTRLLDSANKGFSEGDSAIKEQQTVLAGLAAQWTVFLNNVKKVAMGVGDVALLPLTDLLRNMSGAMQETDIGAQLGEGLRDVIEVLRTATEYISFFTAGVKDMSSGVDWGAALRIGALLIGVTVLRGLVTLAGSLGTQMLGSVPGVKALGNALFGTAQAANASTAANAQAGASAQRTGGLFQKAGQAMAGLATRLTQIDVLYGQMARNESNLAAAQAAHALQLQSISNAYGQVGRRLQTRAALENSIAAAIARRDAAALAGNNRAVATNNRVIASQTAVLNQVIALEATANTTAAAMARLNQQLNQTSQRITALSTGAVRMVEAFRIAREAGASLGVALAAAFQARGGAGATTFAAGITAAMRSATASVVNFGQTAVLAFQTGAAGSTGFRAALLGIQNAATVTGYVLRTALGNATSAGILQTGNALRALRGWILQTALSAAGLGTQWQQATSRMAQGALLATAAVRGLAASVSFLQKAMLSIINIAFFALLIKDALEFLGLWNSVATAIEKGFEAFGGDKTKLPEWLRSTKTTDKMVKASQAQLKAQEAVEESAARYKKETASTLTLLRDAADASKQLTFTTDNPTGSLEALKAGVEALILAESKLMALQQVAKAQDKLRLDLLADVQDAQRKLNETRGGPGEKTAQRNYDDTSAALRNMEAALVKTRDGIAQIDRDAPGAATNIAKSMLSAAEATKVLTRDTDTGRSMLERFADAQARVLAIQQKVAVAQTQDPAALRAPTSATDGAARTEKIRAELAALQSELQKTQAEVSAFEQNIRKAAPGNLAIQRTVEEMKKALDPAAINAVATRFTDAALGGLKGFDGAAIPKITAANLMDAAATKVVSQQLRDMYQSMAVASKTAAEQAKNAYTQAMQEMKRATKEAVDAVGDLNRAWTQAVQKANNFKPDQAMDKKLRERLSVLDMEQRKEEELANKRYAAGSDQLRRELLGIEEKYRKEKELEEQKNQLSKAQRNAGQDIAEYNKLVGSVKQYEEALKKVNAVIADPAATSDQRAKAIEEQKRLYIEAQDEFQRMRSAAQKLTSVDPIGDKLVISEEQKNKFISDVGTMGKALAGVNQSGAQGQEAALEKLAGDQQKIANGYQQSVEAMNLAIKTFQQSGTDSMAAVTAKITESMARTDEFKNKLGELSTTVSAVKLSPGEISTEDIAVQGKKIAAQLSEILQKNETTSIPLSVDRVKLQESFALALADLTGDKGTPVTANVNAKLADGVTEAITKEIEAQVKPKIEVDVKVNSSGSTTVTDNAQRNARGGFIQALKSFATGGKVRGPGTGTSDSILSWLSNGEYVIDAATTAKFGSRFFAGLQQAARSGNMGTLKLPGFATGGPVGLTPYTGTPPAIQQAAEGFQAQRDSVEVTLNVAGKKVSLFGQRNEASALVKALRAQEGT